MHGVLKPNFICRAAVLEVKYGEFIPYINLEMVFIKTDITFNKFLLVLILIYELFWKYKKNGISHTYSKKEVFLEKQKPTLKRKGKYFILKITSN